MATTYEVKRYLSRTDVRAFWCPRCLAQPGEFCIGVRVKRREANHMERVNHALDQLDR